MNKFKLLYLFFGFLIPSVIVISIEVLLGLSKYMYAQVLFAFLFVGLSNAFVIPVKNWVINNDNENLLWDWALNPLSLMRTLIYVLILAVHGAIIAVIEHLYINTV